MTAYSLKYFEENAGRIVREASENSEAIYITLDSGATMILKPAERDEAWSESDPVLNRPANRKHILASIAEYRGGKTVTPDFDAPGRPTTMKLSFTERAWADFLWICDNGPKSASRGNCSTSASSRPFMAQVSLNRLSMTTPVSGPDGSAVSTA